MSDDAVNWLPSNWASIRSESVEPKARTPSGDTASRTRVAELLEFKRNK